MPSTDLYSSPRYLLPDPPPHTPSTVPANQKTGWKTKQNKHAEPLHPQTPFPHLRGHFATLPINEARKLRHERGAVCGEVRELRESRDFSPNTLSLGSPRPLASARAHSHDPPAPSPRVPSPGPGRGWPVSQLLPELNGRDRGGAAECGARWACGEAALERTEGSDRTWVAPKGQP